MSQQEVAVWTEEQANKVYDILVSFAGAPEAWRSIFVGQQTTRPRPPSWTFQGWDIPLDLKRGDGTPTLRCSVLRQLAWDEKEIIEATNEALAALA